MRTAPFPNALPPEFCPLRSAHESVAVGEGDDLGAIPGAYFPIALEATVPILDPPPTGTSTARHTARSRLAPTDLGDLCVQAGVTGADHLAIRIESAERRWGRFSGSAEGRPSCSIPGDRRKSEHHTRDVELVRLSTRVPGPALGSGRSAPNGAGRSDGPQPASEPVLIRRLTAAARVCLAKSSIFARRHRGAQ